MLTVRRCERKPYVKTDEILTLRRTCLIAYFLDYCTDDTARTLRSSYRAPEFCHFDETI